MSRPGLRVSVPVALVVSLAVLAAIGSILIGRQVAQDEAQREAAAIAADEVTVVAEAIRSRMGEAALAASAGGQAPDRPPGRRRPRLPRSGRAPGTPGDPSSTTPVPARWSWRSTTARRRRRRCGPAGGVSGFLALPLDLTMTLRPLQPRGGGIAVDGPQRRLVAVPSSGPGDAPSHTVSFAPDAASEWSLTVWTPPARTPLSALIVAVFLIVAGGALAGWIAVRQRTARSRQAELEGLQRTGEAVSSLAVVAQRTLDLGEVLPAVTTELSSSLGLRGLSLSVPTGKGDRSLFSWGVPPGVGLPARELTDLPAGGTVSLRLSKGGRTVADLRVVAGRHLDRHDVRTLVAAGEVLTSVLSNAEAFAQQQDLVQRMRALDELKSVFLATASHELRTPVATIAGYASLLHDNWETLRPEDARPIVERMDTAAQRLTRMVEDLLDFSRLERGQDLGAEDSVVDLGEVVGEVLDDYPDLAPDHRLAYRPTLGLLVSGSRQATERVVTNLVGNAAKYSPAGSQIRILVQEADGSAELVVEDDGPGIPAAERTQVFSRFYRGRGDEVTRTRGTGLGLAIVTEFAASMGGQVRVNTGEHGGARFVVAFPVAAPAPTPSPDPVPVPDAGGPDERP